MAEHIQRLSQRGTLKLMINGAEVHIRRRSRQRLVIIADSVESVDDDAPPLDRRKRFEAEFGDRTNAELEALLIGMGVDPPARAPKRKLLELLWSAGMEFGARVQQHLLQHGDEEE